jgi:AAA+ superfamily predicted ATPase
MICPRCPGKGVVYRATVRGSGAEVYVCDTCKALWTHPQAIGPATFVDLDLFLQAHGAAGGDAALTAIDRNWDGSQALDAARAAVAADPDDLPARLHLAGLLNESGRAADALEQFAAVLSRDPANMQALYGAAQAAAAGGNAARADGYRRLLRALSGAAPDPAPTTPVTDSGIDGASGEARTAPGTIPPAERLRATERDESGDDDWRAERPSITLADVAGMDAVKRRLNVAFLAPLRNPELRKMYGKSLRGGLLLFGPPGCGKTFIARATAGELGAHFISVGLSDVLDMWLGESERRLHEIFETARRNAPAVLFFDEIDALGRKRSHLKHHAGRNVVNQLLAELDGVGRDNDGVFVLGATNHPWDVDTALLRPGRFDRTVLVLPPDEAARAAILRLHLAGRPADKVDLDWVAARTRDFSGADLAHLCESAAELAMEASVTSGTVRPIATTDVAQALKELRPSTRPWFDTARNYALFANEGGVYDELLAYMRANKLL